MGLQLRLILSGIHHLPPSQLARYGATFAILVVALRIVWVYPRRRDCLLDPEPFAASVEPYPGHKPVFIVAWTGMRGVLALAAAISLPTVLQNGEPFPQRDFIIFLTFCVIFATLVLQGLALPASDQEVGTRSRRRTQPGRTAGPAVDTEHRARLPEGSVAASQVRACDDLRRHDPSLPRPRDVIEGGSEEPKPEQEIVLARYERNLTQELRALERSTAVECCAMKTRSTTRC